MLAEGFLRVLHYKEEKKSASKKQRSQTPCTDSFRSCILSESISTDLQAESAETALNQDELDPNQFQGLKVLPQGPAGLSIPGCPPVLHLDHDLTLGLQDCSLLEQYPDLQVADSGRISYMTRTIPQHKEDSWQYQRVGVSWAAQQGPQGNHHASIPDQGYLVMGANSVNISMDLPGSGLEPMSNSVLNGLLEKQLEEVYMQHLTDNLARCHSHLGNSLLHGLVPLPGTQPQGPDSLEAGLEQGSGGDGGKKISYLSTQNLNPCSSNFSSPVLRISEADSTYLQ
ncbi:uncharacterized protein [Pseudochaenichthys georgianus]|uniref:uncharacterized protein n=1 Tax=Pseudochaenichthys georgianus TaxID=52239 RepID=UPI00146C2B38|nr:uncharacterized protein si:dkey-237j10.2 [Pseudochaenichthys georgianus]